MGSLAGMDNLRILSLGRNVIKQIANLDTAPALEELWISYNQIDKLSGIEKAPNLRILYMSNNKIASWAEIDRQADGLALPSCSWRSTWPPRLALPAFGDSCLLCGVAGSRNLQTCTSCCWWGTRYTTTIRRTGGPSTGLRS